MRPVPTGSALCRDFLSCYALPVEIVNHCFNCGHEFTDQSAEKPETNDLTTE
jgi:hypothetical protein